MNDDIQELFDCETLEEFHRAGIWLPGEKEVMQQKYEMGVRMANLFQGNTFSSRGSMSHLSGGAQPTGVAPLGNTIASILPFPANLGVVAINGVAKSIGRLIT